MLLPSTTGILNKDAQVDAKLLDAAHNKISLKPLLSSKILATTRAAFERLAAVREYELRPTVVPPEFLLPWSQLAATVHDPTLRPLLDSQAPELISIIEEVLTVYMGCQQREFSGVSMDSCIGWESNAFCRNTDSGGIAKREASSALFDTCGYTDCVRSRVSYHMIHNNLSDRPRTNVCSLGMSLPLFASEWVLRFQMHVWPLSGLPVQYTCTVLEQALRRRDVCISAG
ncbi:hypothetical protein CYMTET_23316 [Cymbomonas tetramitiformis]|uniref:Uncharacterized protein n=1 Tax=Cymbomonas tetramitiformis TaxID=36881 RepID=A0AAE0FYE8_9CHLO|nr:hypothetical protein CYMTET_23316 [Cymbomonas tetramitiformis]